MKSRKQILREYAQDPAKLAAYTLEIQEQLQQTRKALAQKEREYQEQLQQTHEQLSLKEEQLTLKEQELAQAQALIAELKQELFGPKADKLDAEQEEQLSQLFQDAQEQAQRPEPLSREVLQDALKNERNEENQERKERKRRRRRNLPPVKLEEQTQVLEPPDKICPHSGKPRKQIGQEVTTEYDLVAAKLIVRKIIRPKYAPCEQSCCSGVAIAPLPPRLIDQSKLGLGLAVHILLSRFDDHVAYYTLERNFNERFGAIIPRQQMVQWVEKIAHLLLALYNLIWEHMRAGPYLQMDETPVKVLDPEVKGKAGQGYLWFYSVPGGDVLLEFNASRGHQTPLKRLEGFQGTIQADGYVAYKTLVGKMPGLRRIGCTSHARRKFHKALKESVSDALWFIGRIRQLYKIERLAADLSPEQRLLMRRRQAAPIWKEMKQKADELIAAQTHLPKSSMGKALSFFRNEYTALVGYLRRPEFQIDNNLVENDVRPSAVGRRRWLFIGHPDAGWRSAVIYTLIQCCRRRGINPQEYLTDALQRLPSMTSSQVHELLPSKWKPKKSTHASVEIPR
jgi:transposase